MSVVWTYPRLPTWLSCQHNHCYFQHCSHFTSRTSTEYNRKFLVRCRLRPRRLRFGQFTSLIRRNSHNLFIFTRDPLLFAFFSTGKCAGRGYNVTVPRYSWFFTVSFLIDSYANHVKYSFLSLPFCRNDKSYFFLFWRRCRGSLWIVQEICWKSSSWKFEGLWLELSLLLCCNGANVKKKSLWSCRWVFKYMWWDRNPLRPWGDLPFSVPNPMSVGFRNDHLVLFWTQAPFS